MEGLLALLNGLAATITSLQTQLADAQAALEVEVKAAYDKGFAEGVASVPKDKLYSQEELDAAVVAAVQPLQDKIVELQVVVDNIPNKIEEANKALKLEIAAKIKNVNVDDLALAAELEA